jgi:hypothetical protein
MSAHSNKELVKRYFDAVNAGDEQRIRSLVTDDFVFKSMYQNPPSMRMEWDIEGFAAAPRIMSSHMNKPIVLTPGTMTAEDDRVAVEAESYGEMKNGKVYANAYHFLFRIRDGKIAEVREYSCSYTAYDVFGEYLESF